GRQARPPRGDRAGRLRADCRQRAGSENPWRQAAGGARHCRHHGGARAAVRSRRRDPDRPGALISVRAAASPTDWTAGAVMAAGVAGAVYLIGVPLVMLAVAALRGPADLLPFEPGARWTLEHVAELADDPVIWSRILPDTFVFVAGTVALVFCLGFTLAWLVERTDLPGREAWFSLILFPLLVPTPVLAIAWIFLMGPNAGWLNLAIRAVTGAAGPGPVNIFGMSGLIFCQAL